MSDSDTVISVENLSKSYLIGHDGPKESYHSLRDTIIRHGKSYARKAMDMARGRQIIQGDSVEEFWALKDVSFEVKRGEVLGIIGRNGAGKSTLLKVLSRITEPTSGRVVLNGRVASLLEVGTGFHPELSGRENIFLNGAILGMSRSEIKAKFDEIVDFAGVEKFLDTPVKRYSSGMYVRLAFAVAAHLEPEILIVDEVLAVGDAEFQKKCLGKMRDVAEGGRTVLFVSHNFQAIRQLCSRSCILRTGELTFIGEIHAAIESYFGNLSSPSTEEVTESSNSGNLPFNVSKIEILQDGKKVVSPIGGLETIFRIHYVAEKDNDAVSFYFSIYSVDGSAITSLQSDSAGACIDSFSGAHWVDCKISILPLNIGSYRISVAVSDANGEILVHISDIATFNVASSNDLLNGRVLDSKFPLLLPQKWS